MKQVYIWKGEDVWQGSGIGSYPAFEKGDCCVIDARKDNKLLLINLDKTAASIWTEKKNIEKTIFFIK